MTREKLEGFVRHLLTFTGGILVSKGLVDESIVMESIGILVSLSGLIWSIKNKD